MKQSLIKKVLALCTASVVLVGSLTGCSAVSGIIGGGNSRGGQAAQSTTSALVVKIENPQYGNIYLDSEIVGTVAPEVTAEVMPKTNGIVTSVNFQAGDIVTEGQVLVTIDSDNVVSSRLNVERAELSLGQAERDLARNEVLYENDGITLQALEQSRDSLRSAQIQLESAKDSYQTLLKNTNIMAPISGVVESRDVEVHDSVSQQKAICVISQKENMQVIFQVSERVKNSMAVGDSIQVTKNGTSYDGTVTEVASKTAGTSGLFEIKARVHNADALANGSHVVVTLTTDKAENVLMIPIDAIYYDNGKPYVYVVKDGKAEITYVETGIYSDKYMEVVSGLTSDTKVVTSWSSKLTNGAAVMTSEEAAEQVAANPNNNVMQSGQGGPTMGGGMAGGMAGGPGGGGPGR